MVSRTNRHHPLFHRVEWTSRRESTFLREHPSLLVEMDRQLHEDLHKLVPFVPLLGVVALQSVINEWQPNSYNQLKSIDNLQLAIEHAGKHWKAQPIERSLGALAIEAIDLQKPFIAESIDTRRIILM